MLDATFRSGRLDGIAPGIQRLIARNPGFMTGPGTNTYVLGQNRFLVLDPGPRDPIHVAKLLEITGGRIDAVIVTHTHPDHSPAAQELAAASGAVLLGRSPGAHGKQDRTFTPSRELEDGEELTIDALTLRILHTPGHASNHVCLLLEERRLLFSGDHVMHGSTVVIAPPDGDMGVYLRSLERLRDEPIDTIAPGHGDLVLDAQAEIKKLIAHRLGREAKVVAVLQQQPAMSLDALLPLVYADVAPHLHAVARHSLLAHLIKLRAEGRVRELPEEPANRWHWLGG